MFIVHVFVHVKPEQAESFKIATIENARQSRKEPGVVQFDFFGQKDDPCRFLLIEVYRTEADTVSHKETAHYKKWRDTVADMMAESRKSIKYDNLLPE